MCASVYVMVTQYIVVRQKSRAFVYRFNSANACVSCTLSSVPLSRCR
nr:MAG TPA: DNA cleavage and packaging protein [Caudoviricetes sp.]